MCAYIIRNAVLVNPGSPPVQGLDIVIDRGVIQTVAGSGNYRGEEIDARGMTAVPGLIELHIQGAGGADVLDCSKGDPAPLAVLAKTQARYGVTSFLATTVFRPGLDNSHLTGTKEYMENPEEDGAVCLGVHLEGPFISTVKKGMIQPECIGEPSPELMGRILELCGDSLKMLTLAPERDGSTEIIRQCLDNGIIPSFGHSEADYAQTLEALKSGISHATHLFNAMMPIHHRKPGPVPALAAHGQAVIQLIPDGVHIHSALIPHILRLFGHDRIALITDGMQAMGLPEGKYVYNGIEYTSEGGTARYHDGTLIGTSLGLIDILKKYMAFTGSELYKALETVTRVPARVLGLEKSKGLIKPGMDADIVLLDEHLDVSAVFVRGNMVNIRG